MVEIGKFCCLRSWLSRTELIFGAVRLHRNEMTLSAFSVCGDTTRSMHILISAQWLSRDSGFEEIVSTQDICSLELPDWRILAQTVGEVGSVSFGLVTPIVRLLWRFPWHRLA